MPYSLRRPRGARRIRGRTTRPEISTMKPTLSTCITTLLALHLGCSAVFSQELLEEVVVTAQKREQRLEDVGISITAIGPAELAAYGVRETTDIVNLVPSLQFNKFSEGSVVFNIRGVSQND